jgi:hypothetical protein
VCVVIGAGGSRRGDRAPRLFHFSFGRIVTTSNAGE